MGGGLATLPFLYAMSAKTGWFTATDISNMIAISESTPGPMGINMATYVGFTSFGVIGTFLAPLSLVLPSIIVIIIVAKILDAFKESKLVSDIFSGLRPASTAMIASAGISVALLAHPFRRCSTIKPSFWRSWFTLPSKSLISTRSFTSWHPLWSELFFSFNL